MREADNTRQMADYILGNLPEADEERLEAEYLADPRLQEQLLCVEDELLDAYAHGHLSPADRAHLEVRFLTSPRGRQKLAFVNSLARLASEESFREGQHPQSHHSDLAKLSFAPTLPIRRIVAAATALLLLLALGWSLRERLLHRFEQAQPRTPGTESPSPRAEEPTALFSVLLEPTSRNPDHDQRVNIPDSAQRVNIQVDVGQAPHNSYRVALMNSRDQVKWSGAGLKPRSTPSGNVVDLDLPATVFEPGEYTVLLSPNANGAPPIAEYVFVVAKR